MTHDPGRPVVDEPGRAARTQVRRVRPHGPRAKARAGPAGCWAHRRAQVQSRPYAQPPPTRSRHPPASRPSGGLDGGLCAAEGEAAGATVRTSADIAVARSCVLEWN
ncbi:hypothetical protein Psuf_007520 [Phytohabitans suffuscus]|uniref:Uncharacterized protein n=1 Tax=Phytohabitans suffuscus TaxID=624315 RepID=A0A6F8YBN3_9ACTN|nr:hypothetical protein Psuf_007520 [Phytohabitans suffuscus]